MKTSRVVGAIVAVHCVAIGSVFLMQGCGTTRELRKPDATETMPPTGIEAPVTPIVQPAVPVEPVAKAPETKTYTVQSGDSLSLIAKRFNVSARDIMDMNGLKSANKIRAGQTLKLPGYVDLSAVKPVVKKHKPTAPVAKKSSGAATAAVAGAGEYIVKSGDSLSKIAHANGTTIKALREVNKLSGDKLKVGQKLALPGAAPAAAEAPAAVPAEAAAPAMGEAAMPQPETAAPMSDASSAVAPATAGSSDVGEGGAVVHIVGANEELNEVAMMYGVSLDELMKVNKLTNSTVKVGQSLKIPSTSR